MTLEIKAGMFAVLRDGTVPEGAIAFYRQGDWGWFLGGHTYRCNGAWSAGNILHDLDIVSVHDTRAEALAYVADNPMNRELHEDGPDLASVTVTVPKSYTEAEAQAMVAAAIRQVAKMADDGLLPVIDKQCAAAILALIPQPAAPAPVVVDWQARAEALEAALDGALAIMSGTVDGPMTPFQRLTTSDFLGAPYDESDVHETVEQMQRAFAILAAAKEPRHE
jgi:hypothetical protein